MRLRLRTLSMAVAASTSCLLVNATEANAAPLLRAASIDVTLVSPTSCEVTMALTIDGAPEIEHRIEAFDGSQVELLAIRGAQRADASQPIGRTRSLRLRPERPSYEFSYRAQQPESRRHRCPLWLPTIPTDGQSREIRLQVALPSDATPPASSMPALAWTGTQGSTRLGHVPAFVRVPYVRAGEPVEWNVVRAMDLTTIALIVAGSAFWIWRRRR